MATELRPQWLQTFEKGKSACASANYVLAEQALARALDLAYDEGAQADSVAEIFLCQGCCFHAQGKVVEAQRAYGQALATFERSRGTGAVEVAEVLQNIGSLLCQTGRAAQAQPLFERALNIISKAYGESNHDVLAIKQQMEEMLQGPVKSPQLQAVELQEAPQLQAVELQEAPQLQTVVPQQTPQPVARQQQPANSPTVEPTLESITQNSAPAVSRRRIPRSFGGGVEADDKDYEDLVSSAEAHRGATVGLDDLIHPREKLWGTVSAVIGWCTYALLSIPILLLSPVILLAGWVSGGINKGHLRSHGIKVSERQFPEVYEMLREYSEKLGITQPELYIVHYDGVLNAFTNRFQRRDFITISSDVFEMAYSQGQKELAFVLCHELAHVKRGHVKWAWLHGPGAVVPFLGMAYSRGCEYTCDRIARYLVPDGALFGLVCLAAGTSLYKHVNLKALYEQQEAEWDFWTWYTEIESTHPNLINRIRAIGLADEQAAISHRSSQYTRR